MQSPRISGTDLITVIGTLVAGAGLIVSVLALLPVIEDDVAAVYRMDSESFRGLHLATTDFRNASPSIPLTQLVANWHVRGDTLTVFLDLNAPPDATISVDTSKPEQEIALRVLDTVRAQGSFKALLISRNPFTPTVPAGKATFTYLVAGNLGSRTIDIVSEDEYKHDSHKRVFVKYGIIFAGIIIPIGLIVFLWAVYRRRPVAEGGRA
jgi:hypothetical protein